MTWDKFAYVKALRGRADLTPAEYQLLVTVWTYTDGDGQHAYPGTMRLAGDLNHQGGDRRVRRMIASLITKGYLIATTTGGGRGHATIYALALPTNPGQDNPGQDNPGHVDPLLRKHGSKRAVNPGQEGTETRVMLTPPSDQLPDQDQSGDGSGEAEATPPPGNARREATDTMGARRGHSVRTTWPRDKGPVYVPSYHGDPDDLSAYMAHQSRCAGLPECICRGAASQSDGVSGQPATSRVDALFDDFWRAYPKRVAKKAAEHAWAKAIKSADAHLIISAAATYAEQSRGSDARFVKHPATWLNAGCWEDDPAPSEPTQEGWMNA